MFHSTFAQTVHKVQEALDDFVTLSVKYMTAVTWEYDFIFIRSNSVQKYLLIRCGFLLIFARLFSKQLHLIQNSYRKILIFESTYKVFQKKRNLSFEKLDNCTTPVEKCIKKHFLKGKNRQVSKPCTEVKRKLQFLAIVGHFDIFKH